ncbi:MAG: glucose-6-phosphate isomerase [Candidatus Lokiarchaeota archaeon]|nr:glucose-6-phosphate isomerase [Candidatus Lokiarchaeota archaeon]MBD3340967.1 glucose-6-phosphate isomerase [Candidatus Lokiarchaeota archaeon]
MVDMENKKSKQIKFDLTNGLSPDVKSTKRMLSDMKGMYYDDKELAQMLKNENSLVYEFYNLDIPETAEHLTYGTTILYPGQVGREYFMTKGHFHKVLNTAEIYYCIRGTGFLLMENLEGKVELQKFKPGISIYVPPNYAHRSINTSREVPLITFYAYRADAGHDYKTIETKGFRKLIIEEEGKPKVIDNPKWMR